MKFLQELTAFSSVPPMGDDSPAASVRLTDTQKSVLLGVYAAPTPELAYEATTGSENVSQAAQLLRSMGLINVDSEGSRAGVTDNGQTALANVNLIDDTGELTDEGQQLLDQQNQIKAEFQNATEAVKYSVLRKLI